MPRKTNAAGIALIKKYEGLRLEAYPDPATGGEPWTIGYGHTGPEVVPGLIITREEAESLLARDLIKREIGVESMVRAETSANQFSALVSLAYNIGLSAMRTSTLVRKLNQGDYAGAADQFLRWDKGNGQRMDGLTKRRRAERTLFLS